ncbi:hypothetical protein Btru_068031 [Bulinus truncatus]|nr:hypothetical protein Btru_068031 [Bulinus truncatus]
MANFSDDDTNERLDAIIGQRKRKGVLEYLVRWGGDGDRSERWESATAIGSDYARAIQNYLESRKTEKKRSTSRSRKVSRSRSRSSSRNRKSPSREKSKSKSRSQSRGRPRNSESTPKKNKTNEVDGNITPNTSHRNTRSRSSVVITNSNTEANISATIATFQQEKTAEILESKSSKESDIMAAPTSKSQLEVQRTHNERCLARDDDKNPRSVIWRLADYAVIFLFIVSLIAVIFLFLEKIIDLEEFKSQAFPNLVTLKTRLSDGVRSLSDSAFYQLERVGDFWLYLTQQPQKSSA